MADKLRVAVLFGGRSGEHDVSLMSARSVLDALRRDRYEILEVGITKEGVWLMGEGVWQALKEGRTEGLTPVTILPDPTRPGLYAFRDGGLERVARVDVVFPVLHGTFGEDGTLQGLLEMADLAYVGAGVVGSAVGMDKGVFKAVMEAHFLPVVAYLVLTRREVEEQLDEVVTRCEALAPYPLFVKPANLGSSVGVTKADNRDELVAGLELAARYDRRIVVERGVPNAREIEVSVLGNEEPQASVPGEIRPGDEFYSYEAKYLDDSSELIIPARLSKEEAERVRALAVAAYKACDLAGMARVDFLLDPESGEFFINEVNTIPGFTQISMYPKLWEASGLPYPDLLDRLIDLALTRKAERDRTVRTYRPGE
ncbi:MAG TPA: D-alanine--D-alanine ligase [Anaerolineae bacterium]|nr:D-alanine--D-alanine ligase [Anaerolineae bacterium]HID84650.1 D-alanine--D-alanine ligase [Anaerolineales bacterium]HIQ08387.1 D-alanine--D-alanine ligase [Anaerolineaceae bacterium]